MERVEGAYSELRTVLMGQVDARLPREMGHFYLLPHPGLPILLHIAVKLQRFGGADFFMEHVLRYYVCPFRAMQRG